MKVTRKRKRKADIPTATTGDIAFLLIVFFMSTTKFDVKEGVKVQLNKAVNQEQEQTTQIQLTEKEMTRLEIMENGYLKVNDTEPRAFSDSELDKLILDKIEMRDDLNRLETDPDLRSTKMLFLVKTNPEAKYNEMVRVVDHLVTYRDRAMISISTAI
jgi:biopolymer transport protein ExbD